jgi:predicted outer membrane protein
MHNHSVLKKLLAVSAVAAMFSAFGVHAQTGGSSSASGTSPDATTQTGKTTREGTAGNTNSRGEQQQPGSSSSSSGSTSGGSQGGTTGVSDSTGAGNPNTTGKTTSQGTVGNTNSQGMEKRQGGTSGTSGAAGATGATGSSGASGASGAAGATGSSSGKLSSGDEKILKAIAQANIDEIEAAKLAQSKSQNEQVKTFAQQMIDDHTKALNETQQVAQQKGVTLPTEPDAKHKAMATKLQAMSGAEFDKAYMSQAGVSDHKAVHSKLVSAAKKAKDSDVKALAQKLEPIVAQHLKSAEQDKSAMSGTKSGK